MLGYWYAQDLYNAMQTSLTGGSNNGAAIPPQTYYIYIVGSDNLYGFLS